MELLSSLSDRDIIKSNFQEDYIKIINRITDTSEKLRLWLFDSGEQNLIEFSRKNEIFEVCLRNQQIFQGDDLIIYEEYVELCYKVYDEIEDLSRIKQDHFIQYCADCSFLPYLEKKIKELENDLQDKILKNSKIDLRNTKTKIDEILGHLKGKNKSNEEILNKDEYKQLIENILHLINYEDLPEIKEPIRELNITTGSLRYSFYKVHKEVYGKNSIRDFFIDFLYEYFQQFQHAEKSTHKIKFSVKPKFYPF